MVVPLLFAAGLLYCSSLPEGRCVVVRVLSDAPYHAVADVDNLVRLVGYAAFVCHDHDCHTFVVQLLQYLHHFHRGLAVQCAGRFVGQDNLGPGDECPGYGHPLFLSAAHFVGHVCGPVLQAQAVQVLQCQRVAPLAAHALVEQGQGYVLDGVLEGYEVERLKDETYQAVAVLGGAVLAQVPDEGTVQPVFARIVAVQYS